MFAPYDGNGIDTERFVTELALKPSEKKQMDYTIVTIFTWLRAKRSFNLLRSAVLCVSALEHTGRLSAALLCIS